MKKILILVGLLALAGAGCTVKRQGYQFIISSEGSGTVVEGLQIQNGLQSSMIPTLSVIPGEAPTDTFSIPKP
ncbi:hypothetical protein HZC53_04550 [Candidatus Uhrbacteria bacterium]|nr:hypothetical protein [Candidatus Uhrbacteria bacterium]